MRGDNPRIIGFAGKMCSGKGVATTYTIRHYGGIEQSFAGLVKQTYRDLILSLTGERVDPWTDKRDAVRRGLQALGTDIGRAYDPDVWVKKGMQVAATALNSGITRVVFSDVRFPNEVEAIQQAGGVVIRLLRIDEDARLADIEWLYGKQGKERLTHISETALDRFDGFDAVIYADTVEDLEHTLAVHLHLARCELLPVANPV